MVYGFKGYGSSGDSRAYLELLRVHVKEGKCRFVSPVCVLPTSRGEEGFLPTLVFCGRS